MGSVRAYVQPKSVFRDRSVQLMNSIESNLRNVFLILGSGGRLFALPPIPTAVDAGRNT